MSLKDLLQKAKEHYDKGDWEEAAKAFGEVIRAAAGSDDDILLAMAHHRKGYAELRRARYVAAISHFRESLSISKAIDDQSGAADCLRGLGYVYWQQGSYAASGKYFQQAIERAGEAKDMAVLGVIRTEYGNLLNFQGKLEDAIQEYKDAIRLLGDAGDIAEKARAHNNLGDALYRQERYKESIDEFKTAIQLGEDSGHLSRVAWARSNAALSLIELGQIALAKDYILLARDYMERIGDKVGKGDTMEALGLALMMEGDHEGAERELRAGLGVATELNVPDRKAIAERNLGRLYTMMGFLSKARSHLSRAATLFKGIGMMREAERTNQMLDALINGDR